jgi:hypothetical protein
MSYCSCVWVGDTDNFPEFINSKVITAQKTHRCTECAHVIQPGEKYERDSGKWHETGFHHFKTCMTCVELRENLFCEGFTYTKIRENLYEHIQERRGLIDESCIASLGLSARAVICDMIESYWNDLLYEEVNHAPNN